MKTAPLKLPASVMLAVQAALDKKADEVVALDLRALCSFTDFFLLASGTNQKQLVAITDSIVETLKRERIRPDHLEGYPRQEWILLDYGDFIVHVLTPRMRRFYDVERLWGDAPRWEPAE
jgi:ribosome-associated protein